MPTTSRSLWTLLLKPLWVLVWGFILFSILLTPLVGVVLFIMLVLKPFTS